MSGKGSIVVLSIAINAALERASVTWWCDNSLDLIKGITDTSRDRFLEEIEL